MKAGEEELTVLVEIVKIDEETGKSYSSHIPIPRPIPKEICANPRNIFWLPACNVGDFIIVEDKIYRRIRGGIRATTDDELAELLAAKLGEALED